MDTHFWDIYRDIRSLIQKPDEAVVYPLHIDWNDYCS